MTKVALITGAAQGIGRAIAQRLANDGFSVAVADRNLEAAKQTAFELTTDGKHAVAMYIDVATEIASMRQSKKHIMLLMVLMFSLIMLESDRRLRSKRSPQNNLIKFTTSMLLVSSGGSKPRLNSFVRKKGSTSKLLARSSTPPHKPVSLVTPIYYSIVVLNLRSGGSLKSQHVTWPKKGSR